MLHLSGETEAQAIKQLGSPALNSMVPEPLLNPEPHGIPPVLTQLDITLQSEQKVGTLVGRHTERIVSGAWQLPAHLNHVLG